MRINNLETHIGLLRSLVSFQLFTTISWRIARNAHLDEEIIILWVAKVEINYFRTEASLGLIVHGETRASQFFG